MQKSTILADRSFKNIKMSLYNEMSSFRFIQKCANYSELKTESAAEVT